MAKVKEGAEKAKEELENAKREIEKRAGALDGVVGANGRKDSAGWFNKSTVYLNTLMCHFLLNWLEFVLAIEMVLRFCQEVNENDFLFETSI